MPTEYSILRIKTTHFKCSPSIYLTLKYQSLTIKRQPHKMVKHTQIIRRLLPTNCLSVFEHFVGSVLKWLNNIMSVYRKSQKDFLTHINPFHATDLFLYPQKTLETYRFSDVFRGYRKRPVAFNCKMQFLQNSPAIY